MASYFRTIFGGHAANTPRPDSKPQKRSPSVPSITKPSPGYIYTAPGSASAPSSSSLPSNREFTNGYAPRTNAPSPLRYATYDAAPVRPGGNPLHQRAPSPAPLHQQRPARVRLYRSSSHKPGAPPAPYPVYDHSASFSSVHSTSSSSIHPGSSASGHRPTPPRTSSSRSIPRSEPRPVLRQNHTWHPSSSKSGPQAHVSFLNPKRAVTLQMHPLLAYSRLHRPLISYDITYTPSSRTVVDRSTHTAIPTHTLSQPATEPPMPDKLVLRSDKLPWLVIASSSNKNAKPAPRFYFAGSSNSKTVDTTVTNLDVLYALHNTLSTRVTQQEWEALGHGSRAQRKITRAYEKRCIKMGGGWDGGVRRIDYLGEKTKFVGVEMDRNAEGGAGKLVFGKA